MPNPLIATTFVVPSSISGSAPAANHPHENVLLFTKFRRTYRNSTDVGTRSLIFDFGSATPLDGVFLNNANFTLFNLAKSDDNVSFTNLYSAFQAVPMDDVINRRKLWSPATAWLSAFNNRYLRLTMATVATPSPGYYELGSVGFPKPVTTLTRNFGVPWNFRAIEPKTALDYAGGGGEENWEGTELAGFELQFGPNVKAARAQMMALRAIRSAPFFFYENRGDLSHAYILTRVEEVPWSEAQATLEAPWRFTETV